MPVSGCEWGREQYATLRDVTRPQGAFTVTLDHENILESSASEVWFSISDQSINGQVSELSNNLQNNLEGIVGMHLATSAIKAGGGGI